MNLEISIIMALKMLYRGPSSRLETLIEKIQQNKDTNSGIDQYDKLHTGIIVYSNRSTNSGNRKISIYSCISILLTYWHLFNFRTVHKWNWYGIEIDMYVFMMWVTRVLNHFSFNLKCLVFLHLISFKWANAFLFLSYLLT